MPSRLESPGVQGHTILLRHGRQKKPVSSDKAKILLIEGKRADHPSFLTGLTRKGYDVESVPNGNSAVEQLNTFEPDVIIIDAASMRTSGKRICHALRLRAGDIPILLIVDPQSAGKNPRESLADVVLTTPLTLQKLLNRLRPLVPAQSKHVLQAGPIWLDPAQRLVRVGNRQSSLTPRLVTILRILMEHPGEVIERNSLFQQAWNTDYTEDTRTLDVHISWLRRAIEVDYRHPQLIKTIRGVGYRLDIEETPPY
ncbi:putative response regulator [Anaerolinea thermophila UNI-1]|uniref:Response regulator n=1 Tax=Anaerolinea thermophila (strain DSM 14523 / JCM 11388 / NBRC 100420 / UNI-1) TaxID=926569 RepID=E8N1W0_ANATU|nr:putative response regulator [Anaerolinea thermophila UNI-1]